GVRALEHLCEISADLLQRRVDVVERRRVGGRSAQLELRVRLDDLDRLATDRSRCPEQRDAFHQASVGSWCSWLMKAVGDDEEVRSGSGEEETVDPVEHPPVAAEEPSRVLDLEIALQRRL